MFLPNSVYFLKSIDSSKSYSIFGEIVCGDNDENVSIFVVDVQESRGSSKHRNQLIGNISKDSHDPKQLPSDYVVFRVDDTKSTLALESIHLPNFDLSDKPFQTQLFLYDLKTFSELSHRIDEQKWGRRPDPISQLLILIKSQRTKEVLNEPSQSHNSKQNGIISFLLSLSIFAQTKLSFLNSAFVKHFQFWTTNLQKLNQNRWARANLKLFVQIFRHFCWVTSLNPWLKNLNHYFSVDLVIFHNESYFCPLLAYIFGRSF